MKPSRLLICLAGLSACLSPLLAVRPSQWVVDSYEDYLEGKANGVSLTFDGRLIPAPTLQEVWDSGTPYVLCAVKDGKGNILVGTGHEGKVFRLDSQGKAQLLFDAEEPDVFALAAGPGDTVYAASGSSGKVYRIAADGKAETLSGPDVKYVWSLAVDRQGTLFLGTGVDGKIYKLKDGKPEVFYDSTETHILNLQFDPEGNLLAGTAPSGYVLRIAPDGKATTLFDAPHAEVRQILQDRYGNILVVGAGQDLEDGQSADASSDPFQQTFQQTPRKKKKTGAEDYMAFGYGGFTKPPVGGLYAVDRDLNVRVLWASSDYKAFAAALDESGDIYLGTSDRGRVMLVRDGRAFGVLVETGQDQVTAMIPEEGRLSLFTSNMGKGFRLLSNPSEKGEYLTEVGDALGPAKFGAITAVLPEKAPAGRFEIWFRSGNSAQPDETWGPWLGPLDLAGAPAPSAPPSRYFQLKVVLHPSGNLPGAAADTWVERLGLTFLPQNQAPRVSSFTVNPSGITYQEQQAIPNTTGIPAFGDHSTFVFPDALLNAVTRPPVASGLVKIYRLGALSMTWNATDPNGDALEYAVDARKLDSTRWERLQDGIRDTTASLGLNRLGEGRFLFRLTASDAPSNPVGQAREDVFVSRVVTIDGTPPVIRATTCSADSSGVKAEFDAQDELSAIFAAEYSVDGGETWFMASPKDGVCDRSRESFAVASAMPAASGPGGSRPANFLNFRVMDAAGNVAVLTVEIK